MVNKNWETGIIYGYYVKKDYLDFILCTIRNYVIMMR